MTRSALVLAIFLTLGDTLAAQGTTQMVNPEAIQFESPVLMEPGLRGFRMDVFAAGANPAVDPPVSSVEVGLNARDAARVRVSLQNGLLDVPNGRYIATIRGRTADGTLTGPSVASDAFVLSRPDAPEERVEAARRERFWTKIGFAIAGGLLLLPLLF